MRGGKKSPCRMCFLALCVGILSPQKDARAGTSLCIVVVVAMIWKPVGSWETFSAATAYLCLVSCDIMPRKTYRFFSRTRLEKFLGRIEAWIQTKLAAKQVVDC